MRTLMGVVVATAVLLAGCSESTNDSEGASGQLGPRFELPGVVIYFPGPVEPGDDWAPAPGLGFVNGPFFGIDQVDKVATAEGVSPYGEVTVLSGPVDDADGPALPDEELLMRLLGVPDPQRVGACGMELSAARLGDWAYTAGAVIPQPGGRRGVLLGRVASETADPESVAVFMAELFLRATNEAGRPLLGCGSEQELQADLEDIFGP